MASQIETDLQSQLQKIHASNKETNAFITVNEEVVKDFRPSAIPRLLEGYTLAVKDSIEVAGLPNTFGTKALDKFIPTRDATVVTRLKDEGAMPLNLPFFLPRGSFGYAVLRNFVT